MPYEHGSVMDQLTAFVMLLIPNIQTYIAKLVCATASHVVAALCTLNEDSALRTALPI